LLLCQTWHGFRLLAVDGSTAQLLETADIVAHFGLWGSMPLARVSQMFDVLNEVTVDALIGSKDLGEREYAAQHLALLQPGDLVLLDRGYPAFWLFAFILAQQAHFCARMPVGVWNKVDHFVASGRREQVLDLDPCTTAKQECQTRNLSTQPLKVRLIRIELDSGEVEVLITSLLDAEQYP